jgi:hypothetical protein
LNREKTRFREKLKKKTKKKYFRNNNIIIFNQQFKNRSSEFQKLILYLSPPIYQIRERATLILLICRFKTKLTVDKEYIRRLKYIKFWIKWQNRQKNQRRNKFAFISKQHLMPESSEIKIEKLFPEKDKSI